MDIPYRSGPPIIVRPNLGSVASPAMAPAPVPRPAIQFVEPAPGPNGDVESSKPHLSVRDLISEATAGLLARPGRLALTALGTVLGIAALVATLGLTETARQQIESSFNELDATKVTVQPAGAGGGFFGGNDNTPSTIPWDAEQRMVRINGVVAAGTKSDVNIDGALSRSLPITNTVNGEGFNISVIASSAGLLDAVRGTMRAGRYFDAGHNERADPVAVLGPGAAEKLDITRIDNLPTVFIGEQPFAVIGIIQDVVREPNMLSAIIIPDRTAEKLYDLAAPRELHVDTAIGAARQVGEATALTLDPVDPTRLRTTVPRQPKALQENVGQSVNALFIILGGVSLLVGALGIANVTLVSVLERTSEIGLRRSLGAAKRHIAAQFLLESTVTGLLGGLIGSSLGLLTIVVVAANRQWTPSLQGWLVFAAAGLGGIIGLLAGTYPSWRAARIEPIAALRGIN